MTKLIQNKETILSINNYNSYGYFEFNNDIDEVNELVFPWIS